jgi:hypothetical protein
MDELSEQSPHGWRIDLNEPPRVLPEDATAALARVSDELAALRGRPPEPGEWERVTAAVRSAARLGADEHDLAVASGLALEAVRSLLRRA